MQKYTAQEILSPGNAKLFEEIVLLLAHSFTNDPVNQWLFSNHTRREYITNLPKHMRLILRLSLLSDALVWVMVKDKETNTSRKRNEDSPNNNANHELQIQLPSQSTIRALAIIIPPHGNATFDSTWAAIRAGALSLPFYGGYRFSLRFMTQFLPGMHEMHEEMFPNPNSTYDNWHLLFLATHPENQGQGLGKQLLVELQTFVNETNNDAARKAKANGEKRVTYPLYLEASNVNAKRLYNRVGFEDRATMTYGTLDEGENLNVEQGGAVIGGRQFGMVWSPTG